MYGNVSRKRRFGFTLIELLVTTVVVGTLAAVVVPAMTKLAPSGDPARAASDVGTVAKAISVFAQHQQPLLPGDIEDLLNHITTADKSLDGRTYRDADVAKWKGPYLPQTGDETDADGTDKIIFKSGGKVAIHSALYRCPDISTGYGSASGSGDLPCTISTDNTTTNTTESIVSIKLSGIPDGAGSEFVALNDIIDGPGEVNPDKFGKLRQNASGSVFYLTGPYNKP